MLSIICFEFVYYGRLDTNDDGNLEKDDIAKCLLDRLYLLLVLRKNVISILQHFLLLLFVSLTQEYFFIDFLFFLRVEGREGGREVRERGGKREILL